MSQAPYGDRVVQDWRAEISCRIDEVGSSFSVFVFLGNVPANPTEWLTSPGFVGTFDIFTPNSSPYGPTSDSVVKGFVLLNKAILRMSGRPSLDDRVVVPILTQNINWGVQKADGEIVRLDMMPSLSVTLQRTPIISPIGGYAYEGEPVYFHDITRGRTGGYHGRQN